MLKVADKQSMDPVQQKLRLAKKQWNKDVSAFIDDLINFKKLTNGQPNKFFKEKSTIKDPIPADPVTIIGALANDFQQLSQISHSIIDSQIQYSQTRRKKQPKGVQPAGVDLSKQLAAWENKYELIVLGSNPVSRFFTKVMNPAIGTGSAADLRRTRMSMLSACADAFKELEKFQVQVVKSSEKSISESNKKLQDIWNKWTLVSRAYLIFKNKKLNIKPEQLEQQIENENLKDEKKIENKSIKDLDNLTVEEDLAVNSSSEQLEKAAQDFLKKWFGKTRHNLSLFDKTSSYRLDCYKLADELRELINQIMNLLEKDLNIDALDPLIKEVNSKIISLRGMMRSLNLSIEK